MPVSAVTREAQGAYILPEMETVITAVFPAAD